MSKSTKQIFSRNLLSLMDKRNITQEDIAKIAGVSQLKNMQQRKSNF